MKTPSEILRNSQRRAAELKRQAARARDEAMWRQSDLRKLNERVAKLQEDYSKALNSLVNEAYLLGLDRARRNKNEAQYVRNHPELQMNSTTPKPRKNYDNRIN